VLPGQIAADTAASTTIDDSGALSLHTVESLLENFDVGGVAEFFPGGFDPLRLVAA